MESISSNVIVGAGPVGAALALLHARDDVPVTVIERLSDRQLFDVSGQRSINLALSHRGLSALAHLGLAARVIEKSVPIRGRLVHHEGSGKEYIDYSNEAAERIWSIRRSVLLAELHAAIGNSGAAIRLETATEVLDIDHERRELVVQNACGKLTRVVYENLFACDGANSIIRKKINAFKGVPDSLADLGIAYKEIRLSDEQGLLELDRLHMWLREGISLLLFPNLDRTFTGTFFGDRAALEDLNLLRTSFQSMMEIDANFASQLECGAPSTIKHVREECWSGDSIALFGDAVHAIAPFYGQGLNCSLEGLLEFWKMYRINRGDLQAATQVFQESRLSDVLAISKLSMENYEEMRTYMAQDESSRFSDKSKHFSPRDNVRTIYQRVTFTSEPYSQILMDA